MSRKTNFVQAAILAFCCALATGCTSDDKTKVTDSPSSGKINISVDESFKPVIEEHIKVYEASYPHAQIIAHYKTEAECFKDLLRDTSTRMIIVTRGLNAREEKYFLDSLNYVPFWDDVASDAIAVVVNIKSKDTIFTIDRLKKQLTGQLGAVDSTTKDYKARPGSVNFAATGNANSAFSANGYYAARKETIVFDGLNATSTIRFVADSILHGQAFDTSVVKAVKSSREVLEYVAANENAIGFVGISWIGNREDTAQVNMLKKVKMAYVQCDRCVDSPYVKPTQWGILGERYPLVRGLYYIVKENYLGLGSGFANFLQYERGQLIFRRAYLGPRMGFVVRDVRFNQKPKKD